LLVHVAIRTNDCDAKQASRFPLVCIRHDFQRHGSLIFQRIHGGSFISGSATAPGLDGTDLAKATSSIVVVLQYRLGAVSQFRASLCVALQCLCQLAFNSPDGRTNFAVRDIVASLQFLHTVVASFGGDASQITLAGQSSGANLIRAILAAPSVSPLFKSAILHSDPMVSGLSYRHWL
jgi:carboxylesterase type B